MPVVDRGPWSPKELFSFLSQYYPVFNHRHRLTDDWLFICYSMYILRYRARHLLVVDCTIWEKLNWKRNYHVKAISWIEMCLNSTNICILLLTAPLIMISLCVLIAPLNLFFCHFFSQFFSMPSLSGTTSVFSCSTQKAPHWLIGQPAPCTGISRLNNIHQILVSPLLVLYWPPKKKITEKALLVSWTENAYCPQPMRVLWKHIHNQHCKII